MEIESLSKALYNARELRDHAVTARNNADRERDHNIALFEKKCRELETFREERDQQLRALQAASEAHGQSGSRTYTTRTTRTGGGHSSNENHGARQSSGSHIATNGNGEEVVAVNA